MGGQEAPNRLWPGHLGPVQAGLLLLAAFAFLLLCYVPLTGGDLWAHVNYGDWILAHGALPAEDPFMPLARGMEVVDGEWLSQVLLAAAAAGGDATLPVLLALVLVATGAVLGRAYWLRGGGLFAPLAALAATVAVGWSRFLLLRPESFAALLFALLLLLTARGERQGGGSWAGWLGLAVLFALWANLHPSFAAGWAFLACGLVARAVEAARRERSLLAPLSDPPTRRAIWRLELAVAATLINPYGARLLLDAVLWGSANLRSLADRLPPALAGPSGWALGLAWVAVLALVALRGRRLPVRDFLLLVVFAAATAQGVRALDWLAPVLGWVLAPHLGWRAPVAARRPRPRAGLLAPGPLWTVAGAAVVWLAFALSPASDAVFGRQGGAAPRRLADPLPPALVEHLAREPAAGPVYGPRRWADQLLRAGPPAFTPFVTSSVAQVPQQVWRDYLAMSRADGDWERTLTRYRIETVLVDRARQRSLAGGLRRLDGWRLTHEDRDALVFRRQTEPRARREPPAAAGEAPS